MTSATLMMYGHTNSAQPAGRTGHLALISHLLRWAEIILGLSTMQATSTSMVCPPWPHAMFVPYAVSSSWLGLDQMTCLLRLLMALLHFGITVDT